MSSGNTNFHIHVNAFEYPQQSSNFLVQVNQCVEGEDYYECSNTIAVDGNVKTLKATYICCHGFKEEEEEKEKHYAC